MVVGWSPGMDLENSTVSEVQSFESSIDLASINDGQPSLDAGDLTFDFNDQQYRLGFFWRRKQVMGCDEWNLCVFREQILRDGHAQLKFVPGFFQLPSVALLLLGQLPVAAAHHGGFQRIPSGETRATSCCHPLFSTRSLSRSFVHFDSEWHVLYTNN